jgi:cell shape-determining protein MreC
MLVSMIIILKRLFLAVLISCTVLWLWPLIDLYFRSNSSTNVNKAEISTKIFKSDNTQNFSTDLKPKYFSKIIDTSNIQSNFFTIDKGQAEGVLSGAVVTNYKGQVIGLVSKVEEKSSIVKTITNPEVKLAVWVGKSSNKGLLSGLYGYTAEVDWVQDSTDLINQPVYTSNFSQNTKEGLYIGKVQDVRLGKSGSFYAVSLNDLTNIWQTDGNVLVW